MNAYFCNWKNKLLNEKTDWLSERNRFIRRNHCCILRIGLMAFYSNEKTMNDIVLFKSKE